MRSSGNGDDLWLAMCSHVCSVSALDVAVLFAHSVQQPLVHIDSGEVETFGATHVSKRTALNQNSDLVLPLLPRLARPKRFTTNSSTWSLLRTRSCSSAHAPLASLLNSPACAGNFGARQPKSGVQAPITSCKHKARPCCYVCVAKESSGILG